MEHNKALQGAAVGGGSGIVLGGTLSCLMALGILAIPGVGPLIAAGPIIATLAGAGVGAVAGELTRSIIGMKNAGIRSNQVPGGDGRRQYSDRRPYRQCHRTRSCESDLRLGRVTAAEAVVDHAYSRPSGAVGAAMSRLRFTRGAMRSSRRGTDATIIEPSALRSYRMASSQRDQE